MVASEVGSEVALKVALKVGSKVGSGVGAGVGGLKPSPLYPQAPVPAVKYPIAATAGRRMSDKGGIMHPIPSKTAIAIAKLLQGSSPESSPSSTGVSVGGSVSLYDGESAEFVEFE